jgi:DNA-binding transcriptional ArsR family regulator
MSISQLSWNYGSAFDLFASLHVLHEPARFGVRPAWAAGVRSRLPSEHRDTLELAEATLWIPLSWIQSLDEPKDSATALRTLRHLPARERLPVLGLPPKTTAEVEEIFREVANRGNWKPEDLDALRAAYQDQETAPRSKVLETRLAVWAQAESFGERYLRALQSYQDVFFAEEEKRIRGALVDAIDNAQVRAEQVPIDELIEELSHGVRLENELDWQELVLVPSYWISPLVIFEKLGEGKELFMFGARPADVSLVPGELVPDGMLRTIKTLGDPTRLRILRYLSQESITPAELARRLRLRAPTVTHHLNLLRLAGLVYLILGEKGKRHYEARPEAVDEAFEILKTFLGSPNEEKR